MVLAPRRCIDPMLIDADGTALNARPAYHRRRFIRAVCLLVAQDYGTFLVTPPRESARSHLIDILLSTALCCEFRPRGEYRCVCPAVRLSGCPAVQLSGCPVQNEMGSARNRTSC